MHYCVVIGTRKKTQKKLQTHDPIFGKKKRLDQKGPKLGKRTNRLAARRGELIGMSTPLNCKKGMMRGARTNKT